MMAKKPDELSTAELVDELYLRLGTLSLDVDAMTSKQREKFNDLSARMFLIDSGKKLPDNNTVRKQALTDGFTSHVFLFDLTERAIHEAGRNNSELKNKSELIRILLSNYFAKLHPRIWNDVASTPEYGSAQPRQMPGVESKE